MCHRTYGMNFMDVEKKIYEILWLLSSPIYDIFIFVILENLVTYFLKMSLVKFCGDHLCVLS